MNLGCNKYRECIHFNRSNDMCCLYCRKENLYLPKSFLERVKIFEWDWEEGELDAFLMEMSKITLEKREKILENMIKRGGKKNAI